MSEVIINASRREAGRSQARLLRRQSIVPGIYYFHGEESIPLAVHELALRPLIYTTESHLVRLKLDDGTEKTCQLKDITFDPITDRPTHFDLLGVAAGEVMRMDIPVALVGQAAGQINGGVVEHVLHHLEVECLPTNLPEHIEVDISALNIGDSIHVSDLSIPNVNIVTNGELSIVLVTAPRVGSDAEIAATEADAKAKGDE